MGAWFFRDTLDYLSCQNHGMFQASNAACAWSEGWSDFLPLAVNGDQCFDYFDVGPCGPVSDNIENQGWSDGKPTGDQVEGRIAGTLWDIIDANNEGYDRRTDAFWAIWTLMGEEEQEFNVRDFYDHWTTRWGRVAPIFLTFHQNTIFDARWTYLPIVLKNAFGGFSGGANVPGSNDIYDSPLPLPSVDNGFQSPLPTPAP